jgi:hypothetical protein
MLNRGRFGPPLPLVALHVARCTRRREVGPHGTGSHTTFVLCAVDGLRGIPLADTISRVVEREEDFCVIR